MGIVVWKVRNQITSAIVGDANLWVSRGRISLLGNHPDASLRPLRAPAHASKIVAAYAHRRTALLCIGADGYRTRRQGSHKHRGYHMWPPHKRSSFHVVLPPGRGNSDPRKE